MARSTLISGALLMALGILSGAFGAHMLQESLSDDLYRIFRTAVEYHYYHALGLLLIGVLLLRAESGRASSSALLWYHSSVWLIWAGVIIFCGTLYIYVLTSISWLGRITPIGGISFLLGWSCLIIALAKDGKGTFSGKTSTG